MNVEKEDAALIDGSRRSEDGGHPLVEVVSLWPSTGYQTGLVKSKSKRCTMQDSPAIGRRIQGDLRQLLLDSTKKEKETWVSKRITR
jgi:hypothetical protein